ncbi:MAG: NAD-dependent epimerase/dehydratase family protein [Nitrospinae bacterium]|nr:NAD-dependent epimerase/dehydratase family protein [Nitrospinota bacterium]
MKAFVTGSTGFIGSHLVRELLNDGHEARVLVRKGSNLSNIEGLGLETAFGDLRDYQGLLEALRGCEILYHAAAHYSFWDRDKKLIYGINVDGTRNILRAAGECGLKRIVYTSTVGCIGIPEDGTPGNEDTPLKPQDASNPYKHSKYLAELEAINFAADGLPVVIVNPSAPVGAMDIKPTPTGKVIVDFLNRKMPAYLDTGLNLIDVKDCARGHILAAEKGRTGERYILGNQNMALREILEALEEITGLPAPKFKIPYPIALAAGYVSHFVSDYITHSPPAVPLPGVRMAKRKMFFDSSKAVRELGLPQNPVKEALKEAVEWYKGNGYVLIKR